MTPDEKLEAKIRERPHLRATTFDPIDGVSSQEVVSMTREERDFLFTQLDAARESLNWALPEVVRFKNLADTRLEALEAIRDFSGAEEWSPAMRKIAADTINKEEAKRLVNAEDKKGGR